MPSETDQQPPSLANSIVGFVTACCFVMTTVVACHQFAPLAKKWWNAPRHCHCQECVESRQVGIHSDIVRKIFEGSATAGENAKRLERIEEKLGMIHTYPPLPLPPVVVPFENERPPVTPMPPIAPPLIQMPEI